VSLLDLLDFCAEVNFDAIDPTGYFFPGYPKVPSDNYINEFKRRAFQLGLDISGTGVRNDFASPDKAKRDADVQHVKEWVECAARLGAPVLRVFAGPQPQGYTWDQVADWMVDELRRCVEHAEKFGVLIGIQNHGDTLKTADDVLKIVDRVKSPWFGVIVDTGYFLSPDPYQDIAKVIPHAVNWQIKEKVDGAAGHSRTDMKRLVKIIRSGGYRGYLPIETLSAPGGNEPYDPRERVVALLSELREALKQGEREG
jgi:sugar phosphate isomerase/epimerase